MTCLKEEFNMAPLYDYACEECEHMFVQFKTLADYQDPADCPKCSRGCDKIFITPPNVRTAKLSRTFLEGTRRKEFEPHRRAAELEIAKTKVHHESEDYQAFNKEIDTILKPKK